MHKIIIIILFSLIALGTSAQEECGCDCNIVQIYEGNTTWVPRLDADQDSFYQDGSGMGYDPDDRDACNPGLTPDNCDADADGLINLNDNCNVVYNPSQTNSDGDTIGDACDICPNDTDEAQTNSDGDTHGDACDICPNDTDEAQTNSDGDTHGDACDNCPSDTNESQTDGDGDDVGDTCDNCIAVINTSQTNSDADSLGDACDYCDLITDNANLNDDGDSYGNVCDNCPDDTNEGQEDGDSDGVGDICDECPDDGANTVLDTFIDITSGSFTFSHYPYAYWNGPHNMYDDIEDTDVQSQCYIIWKYASKCKYIKMDMLEKKRLSKVDIHGRGGTHSQGLGYYVLGKNTDFITPTFTTTITDMLNDADWYYYESGRNFTSLHTKEQNRTARYIMILDSDQGAYLSIAEMNVDVYDCN